MKKFCPFCGTKIETSFKFCPECGKGIPAAVKGKQPEKVETNKKVETKNKKTTKRKTRLALPQIPLNFKIQRKTAIAIVAIVCLATIVSAGVMVTSPFEATVVKSLEERTIPVTIENNCGHKAVCHLKVGALKYQDTFELHNGESITIDVDENQLFLQEEAYDLTLYAKVYYTGYAEVLEQATVSGVSSYVTFKISQSETTDYHIVETLQFQ